MQLTDDDKKVHDQAIQWVKDNKHTLLNDLLDKYESSPVQIPAASFMAGTPGAGKTEFSKKLISAFENKPLRIDADEFRDKIPGYNGSNSYLVQSAASLAVDKIMDKIFHKKIPFLLDGTFSKGKSAVNIKRALRHGYSVQIYYIYQDPLQAWGYTKIREKEEGRMIPKDGFIDSYFMSRKNVNEVKQEFGDSVVLSIIIKDYVAGTEEIFYNVNNVDERLPTVYTKEELERKLL